MNLDDYCHFTSPIRRYPDTAIHRILTGVAEGITVDRLQKKYQDFSREAAVLSSACELRAQRAERQAEKCYMAEYMRRHLGETFDGIVSGATARGIFVQLVNSVEGFVGVEDFPDCEFQFDGLLTHTDVRSGRRLTVGDPMKVQVAAADVATAESISPRQNKFVIKSVYSSISFLRTCFRLLALLHLDHGEKT